LQGYGERLPRPPLGISGLPQGPGESPFEGGFVVRLLPVREHRLRRLRQTEQPRDVGGQRAHAGLAAAEEVQDDGPPTLRGQTVPGKTVELRRSGVVVQARVSSVRRHSLTGALTWLRWDRRRSPGSPCCSRRQGRGRGRCSRWDRPRSPAWL